MPIYIPAGAIIPVDAVGQYVYQKTDTPTTLRIYLGADGVFTFYDDDERTLNYLDGKFEKVKISWNDKTRKLTMAPLGDSKGDFIIGRKFRIKLITTPLE